MIVRAWWCIAVLGAAVGCGSDITADELATGAGGQGGSTASAHGASSPAGGSSPDSSSSTRSGSTANTGGGGRGAGGDMTTSSSPVGSGGGGANPGAGGAQGTGGSPGAGGATGAGGSPGAGGGAACHGFGDACTDCAFMQCDATYCTCFASPSCVALDACLNACTPGSASCQQACLTAHPDGISTLLLLSDCTFRSCDTPCPNSIQANPCQSCLYTQCSGEMNTCLANPDCTALVECAAACAPTNMRCQVGCYTGHPNGQADANPVLGCIQNQCQASCM